jgi:hypothetical protein
MRPILSLCVLLCAACGDGVKNEKQARRAYLGLDAHVDKAITLGFAGFNAARAPTSCRR